MPTQICRSWMALLLASLAFLSAAVMSPTTVAAQPTPTLELKIGWFPVPNAEPLFVALDKGLFEQAGVHIDTIQLQAGPQAVQSELAGAIDGSIGGTVPMAYAALKNVPVKMVITNGTEPPGSHLAAIVVPNGSKLHKVHDLKGKIIALYCLHCITHAATLKAISQSGLSPDDIHAIEMPGPDMLPAVLNHQVDAIYLYEPLLVQALTKGTRVLIYEDQIFPNMAMGGWFFTDKDIASKKKAIQAFVNGMRAAMEFINSNPRASKVIFAKYLKLDPALAPNMGTAHFDPSGKLEVADMNEVIKTMVALKMMPSAPNIESVVTNEFLK